MSTLYIPFNLSKKDVVQLKHLEPLTKHKNNGPVVSLPDEGIEVLHVGVMLVLHVFLHLVMQKRLLTNVTSTIPFIQFIYFSGMKKKINFGQN